MTRSPIEHATPGRFRALAATIGVAVALVGLAACSGGGMAKRWVRAVVLWSLALLVVDIVLAVIAVTSLMDAEQRCFFEYPSVACPDGQDWRVGLLTFAFFGVPVIWLVGAVAAIVGQVLARRRRESKYPPRGR